MKNSLTSNILLATITAVLVSVVVVKTLPGNSSNAPTQAEKIETAFERVMRTQIIRCGYGLAKPAIWREPNSKEIVGQMADLMRDFTRITGIKIEWSEELDWGNPAAALDARRIDVICSTIWNTPARARAMTFSQPLFYSAMETYVRFDDHRFDGKLEAINDPAVKLAVNPGDVSEEIARINFPKAQFVPKAALIGDEAMLMDVATNKADVAIISSVIADDFIRNTPHSLRKVSEVEPVRLYGHVFAVRHGETALRDWLDIVIANLALDGSIRHGISQWYAAYPTSIKQIPIP